VGLKWWNDWLAGGSW
jgi:hypothetical protein